MDDPFKETAGPGRPHLNGHGPVPKEEETSRADHRVVYVVLGAIFLAFLIGVTFLAVSIMSDWQ